MAWSVPDIVDVLADLLASARKISQEPAPA